MLAQFWKALLQCCCNVIQESPGPVVWYFSLHRATALISDQDSHWSSICIIIIDTSNVSSCIKISIILLLSMVMTYKNKALANSHDFWLVLYTRSNIFPTLHGLISSLHNKETVMVYFLEPKFMTMIPHSSLFSQSLLWPCLSFEAKSTLTHNVLYPRVLFMVMAVINTIM